MKAEPKLRMVARRAPHPLLVVASGIFGYLLWLRYHLFIQSHSVEFTSRKHLDIHDAPAKTVEATGSFHLKKLATDLLVSYSAQDGIASADRQDFVISFQNKGARSKCSCDIVSVDCLDMISCDKSMHNSQKRKALAWMGIEIRRAIKVSSEYMTSESGSFRIVPLGKLLQYYTMSSWVTWRTRNTIFEYNPTFKSIFIEPSQYRHCYGADNGKLHPVIRYNGPTCFYKSPRASEDSAGTIIEDEAKRWYNSTVKDGKDTKRHIRHLLDDFLRKHQPLPMDEDSKKSSSHDTDVPDSADLAEATYGADFSAFGNLILFAHMTRLQFNRRPFLDKIYKKQLTGVVIPKDENQTNAYNEDPFIIALHMRRGDACGDPNPNNYESLASDLFSKAQTGGDRKCYQTEVYLRAVTRIREQVPKKRPIHVYLATDDVGNVIQEIFTSQYEINNRTKADGTTETVMDSTLGVDKWYFLNITRDHFQYKSDSIEAMENADNQPLLGETAVTDLWLLSHGHAFVGHLGSRFGKVSWLLATARRNSFIPFFSVDGHSKHQCLSRFINFFFVSIFASLSFPMCCSLLFTRFLLRNR